MLVIERIGNTTESNNIQSYYYFNYHFFHSRKLISASEAQENCKMKNLSAIGFQNMNSIKSVILTLKTNLYEKYGTRSSKILKKISQMAFPISNSVKKKKRRSIF